MKSSIGSSFLSTIQSNGSIVHLHNDEWINNQRIAGRIVASVFKLIENELTKSPSKTLDQLDKLGEEYIRDNNCIPTFKGYKGRSKSPYPNSLCLSNNLALVHSIATNDTLNDGDVLKVDLGATYNGAIADAARTFIYDEPKNPQHLELINATKECLEEGIKAVKIGNRIGAIGQAIYKCSQKYKHKFSLITDLGGHSLSYDNPHHGTFIANKANGNEGLHITPGLTLAIEPLLCLGSNPKISLLDDGWTIRTPMIGAHFEDSIFIHKDGSIENMTQ